MTPIIKICLCLTVLAVSSPRARASQCESVFAGFSKTAGSVIAARASERGASQQPSVGMSEALYQEASRRWPGLEAADEAFKDQVRRGVLGFSEVDVFLKNAAQASWNLRAEILGRHSELCRQYSAQELKGFMRLFEGVADPAVTTAQTVCDRMVRSAGRAFGDTAQQARYRLRALAGLLPGAPCELLNPTIANACTAGVASPRN